MINETTPPAALGGRRARTRAALVGAAQALLAQGRRGVSIQDITALADVGFGSFYNYFSTKEELFDAALVATLDAHDALIAAVTRDVEDPAELFSIGLRTTGRVQRAQPELVRILLHQGTSILIQDRGIAPRARADLQAGMRSGRFTFTDPALAFAIAGGSLLGLLQMLDADEGIDADAASDDVAETLLRAFGVDAAEAAEVAHRPLPTA